MVVELTRFRVAEEKVDELLAARPTMLEEFAADRAGFVDARLVRLPDNEWLDIVTWGSADDFAASRQKGGNLPGIKTFFDAIDSLVTAEQGELMEAPGR